MREAEHPDAVLMRRAAQGDTQAFDALLGRHGTAVSHYLTRLVAAPCAAEELAQECWLRVWRARHSYQPMAAFRTWLFTVSRRPALDHAKAPRLPGRAACGRNARRFQPVQREAVVLRDMEGMIYADIARVTGCPLDTVKSRLSAGRAQPQAVARAWLTEPPCGAGWTACGRV